MIPDNIDENKNPNERQREVLKIMRESNAIVDYYMIEDNDFLITEIKYYDSRMNPYTRKWSISPTGKIRPYTKTIEFIDRDEFKI